MIDITAITIYILLGMTAGFAAGLLGIGGGLIMVPALAALFRYFGTDASVIMQLAVGTSLSTITITGLSATLAHHRRKTIAWPIFLSASKGIVLGVITGTYLASILSSDTLSRLFGCAAIVIALHMALERREKDSPPTDASGRHSFAGGIIGMLSAMLGIGGGTLMVPYLKHSGVSIRQAVATSSACGLPISLVASVCFVLLGQQQVNLPAATIGYIHWPSMLLIAIASVCSAPIGVAYVHRISKPTLTRVFALVLAATGATMLV